MLKTFLAQRGAIVLQQFKKRGLYPSVDAPEFSCFGGVFTNSLNLTVKAEQPVYYTLDGRDPREVEAGILYTNGVMLTQTARVKARARTADGKWSALTEAVFRANTNFR